MSGRVLVGLRWWNYVDESGENQWVFESLPVPACQHSTPLQSHCRFCTGVRGSSHRCAQQSAVLGCTVRNTHCLGSASYWRDPSGKSFLAHCTAPLTLLYGAVLIDLDPRCRGFSYLDRLELSRLLQVSERCVWTIPVVPCLHHSNWLCTDHKNQAQQMASSFLFSQVCVCACARCDTHRGPLAGLSILCFRQHLS